MKISQKLIILLLLIALIPLSIIGVFAYISIQNALTGQIKIQIANTLNRQANKIDELVTQDLRLIDLLAVHVQARFLMTKYYEDHSKDTQAELNKLLKEIRLDNRSFRRIHILSPEGIIIGSSDERFVGKDYKNTKMFQLGSQTADVALFFKDVDGILGHYLVSRMLLEGKFIGIALIEAQADSYTLLTKDYIDTGKTGETFIIGQGENNKHVYLTPLRFKPDAALSEYVQSNTDPPLDYRNHPVLLVTKEIPITKWILGVKIDEAEIYAPVTRLRDLTIVVVAITTVVVFFLALYFSRFFTSPIIALTNKTRLIMSGDLNQQIDVSSKDEIGTLGTAFNQMTASLKQKITQLHDEQIKLQASINSLSVGYIMVDRNNNILTINQTAKQALCRSSDSPLATIAECTLSHIEDELKDAVNLRAFINQCFIEKKVILIKEVRLTNKFLKIFITPIITIGVIGAVVLIDDITEAKIIERSKDEFFSIASHELRTPLTAIRGNTSMIKQFFAEKIKADPELSDMIQDIHESSVRLIGIVNDFLDTSRLEMGKMEFKKEQFDILALIQEIIKEYQEEAQTKNLYLKLDPPITPLPNVLADKNRTKQVLINLVNNAIKFTDTGGVTVKIFPIQNFLKVMIIDTGRGISPESQSLLFRKFQQAGESLYTRDTTKGTGLGLYISKLIMQDMGGEVRLESTAISKGSAFSITLPVVIGNT